MPVEAGRVALDGHRTATEDPKGAASWWTVPAEAMHAGTVTLLRSLRAHQAADRLAAGTAYEDNGYVLVDALGHPIRPEAYSDRFAVLCREARVPRIRMHDVRHSVALMPPWDWAGPRGRRESARPQRPDTPETSQPQRRKHRRPRRPSVRCSEELSNKCPRAAKSRGAFGL